MSYDAQCHLKQLVKHYFNGTIRVGALLEFILKQNLKIGLDSTIVNEIAQYYGSELFYDLSIQLINLLIKEQDFIQIKNLFAQKMLNQHHIDVIYQMAKDGLIDQATFHSVMNDPLLADTRPSLLVGIHALVYPHNYSASLIKALKENPALIECIHFDHDKYLELLKSSPYTKSIPPEIYSAIQSDNISEFQAGLERVNSPNMHVYMNIAASQGSVNIFKFILINGTEPESDTANCAIQGGSLDIIRTLLDNGIDFFNANAAVSAITAHRIAILEWIDNNDPNVINQNPSAVLTASIRACDNESFELLLSKINPLPVLSITDFDIESYPFLTKYLSKLTKDQRNSFLVGSPNRKSDLFELLVLSPEVDFDACDVLCSLLARKNFQRVNQVLKRKDLDLTSIGTQNPLRFALQRNCDTCGLESDERFGHLSKEEYQRECVNAMLQMKDLTFKSLIKFADQTDENGNTLLHIMARDFTESRLEANGVYDKANGIQQEDGNNLVCIFSILAKNCDKNAKNNRGETAGDIIQKRFGDYITQVLAGCYRLCVDKRFPALTNGECTFKRFKKKYVIQPHFLCSECDLDSEANSAICEICASKCHNYNLPNRHRGALFVGVTLHYCDCPGNKDPKCHKN